MGNQIKTAMLLAALTIFFVMIGGMLGGRQGMIIALVFATGMNFFSYWFSDKIVLKMYRATEATQSQAPELYGIMEEITRKARLPMPKIFIIPQDSPNAFATGRDPEHAVVAVTQGLLSILNREELKGVLAHEMAHVNNRDILIGTIAATMAGAVMMLATMFRWSAIFGGADDEHGGIIGALLISFLAPIGAMLIQMAISRSREFQADKTGAYFAGNAQGLAGALNKLDSYSRQRPMHANPQTAHMFIVNPLAGGGIAKLFSTHPPINERIQKLTGINQSSNMHGSDQGTGNRHNNNTDKGSNFWDRMK